jgi:hypothetical protein
MARDNFEFERLFYFFSKTAENLWKLNKSLRNSFRKNSLSVKLLARDSIFIEKLSRPRNKFVKAFCKEYKLNKPNTYDAKLININFIEFMLRI